MSQTTPCFRLFRVALALVSTAGACTIGGCQFFQPQQPRVVYVGWTAPRFDPAQFPTLAILVEDQSRTYNNDEGFMRQIEDEFNQALLAKGYRIAARSDAERVFKELKFQRSGWTDKDAAELGRMLNTSGVVIVSLVECKTERVEDYSAGSGRTTYRYYASVGLSGRVIGVQNGEIMGQGTHRDTLRIGSDDNASSAVVNVAGRLASGFPSTLPEVAYDAVRKQ